MSRGRPFEQGNTIGRGRPKGSKNIDPVTPAKKVKKRKLSPEGRKRIADAMKKRWAERRRLLAKN